MATAPDNDYALMVESLVERLGEKFRAACRSYPMSKAAELKRLVSEIGTVDFASEGLDSIEGQRDLSIKFHWGHNHEFDDDLIVKGRMADRHLSVMAQFMIGFGLSEDYFQGKTVIDIGCWTGGTTLSLNMMGAASITALEEVNKYRRAAETLCNNIYSLNVDFSCANVYDLNQHEVYELAYFPGVVYHLSDPVLALRRIFNALVRGGECLVESAGIDSEDPVARFEGNYEFHDNSSESTENLNRGGWNWFLPSASCLDRWIREAGFEGVTTYRSVTDGRIYGRGLKLSDRPICQAGLSVRGM
jgi:2-polyprenyl-3-methyl-5-hydroxy-6-metoxy-1,4-benzoquinol methylase